jgi:hypothetical protein
MKNITKSFIALFAVLAISCSSDDVEDRPVIVAEDAPVMSAPTSGSSYVLEFQNASNLAERFVWTSANFGQSVAVNYTLEIDVAGNEFATPESLGSVIGQNQLSVSVETLNGAALSLGAEPFVESNYEVRVKASVNDTFEALYSNVATISVTAYTTSLPKIYVVGSFLDASGYGGNWTASNGVPLAASGFGETDYQGYVYINEAAAQFKFLPTNVDFSGDYGDTGPSDGSFSGTIEQDGEVNAGLPTAEAGYYLVKVDTDALTYSLRKQTWRIIGAATPGGWDNDTDLTYDPVTKKWSAVMNLVPGEFKFRANQNWNDDADNFGTGAEGLLAFNGGNIAFEGAAGSYTVTLDLSNPRAYSYTITAN